MLQDVQSVVNTADLVEQAIVTGPQVFCIL